VPERDRLGGGTISRETWGERGQVDGTSTREPGRVAPEWGGGGEHAELKREGSQLKETNIEGGS